MTVAQRGTSSTGDNYKTVDRFAQWENTVDEACTQAQADVSSGTTPYTLGFRKSYKITNGNQTSGAQAGSRIFTSYTVEAQDIANSGWNYTDSNSFITLSFWVKASVAGDYTLNMNTHDGTPYRYLMEYSLLANTWKHVVFKIPGNSNLTVNNDNGLGLQIMWYPFLGSNYIQADQENNWYASSNGKYGTVSTTNWWTTNDATWEITGVQLEVGDTATTFEHRSHGDELQRCQRYCVVYGGSGSRHLGTASAYNSTNLNLSIHLPVSMRDTPNTSTVTTGGNWLQSYVGASGNNSNATISIADMDEDHHTIRVYLQNAHSGLSAGQALWIHTLANAKLILSAEL